MVTGGSGPSCCQTGQGTLVCGSRALSMPWGCDCFWHHQGRVPHLPQVSTASCPGSLLLGTQHLRDGRAGVREPSLCPCRKFVPHQSPKTPLYHSRHFTWWEKWDKLQAYVGDSGDNILAPCHVCSCHVASLSSFSASSVPCCALPLGSRGGFLFWCTVVHTTSWPGAPPALCSENQACQSTRTC